MDDSIPEEGYDAIICMGNSFAHLPDYHGDNRDHIQAFKQFLIHLCEMLNLHKNGRTCFILFSYLSISCPIVNLISNDNWLIYLTFVLLILLM